MRERGMTVSNNKCECGAKGHFLHGDMWLCIMCIGQKCEEADCSLTYSSKAIERLTCELDETRIALTEAERRAGKLQAELDRVEGELASARLYGSMLFEVVSDIRTAYGKPLPPQWHEELKGASSA